MTFILIAVLSSSLEAGPPGGTSNAVQTAGAASVAVSEANLPFEKEYQKLLSEEDAAQAEVEKWRGENTELKAKGESEGELNRRIRERFEPVRKAYDDFLSRHPDHARAHLTYGNLLSQREDETGAQAQWEKALELDPTMPAVYNNLAGLYAERGRPKQAFDYFSKAIELNPSEGLFYHDFADSIYVLRKRAMEIYGISEQQVYVKSLQLYSNAARLDPTNYLFAWDLAQTYYAITPLSVDGALQAWTNALNVAHNQMEREGVYVHLARVKMLAGRHAEARAHLSAVTNENYSKLKANLIRGIEERENSTRGTSTVPPAAEKKP